MARAVVAVAARAVAAAVAGAVALVRLGALGRRCKVVKDRASARPRRRTTVAAAAATAAAAPITACLRTVLCVVVVVLVPKRVVQRAKIAVVPRRRRRRRRAVLVVMAVASLVAALLVVLAVVAKEMATAAAALLPVHVGVSLAVAVVAVVSPAIVVVVVVVVMHVRLTRVGDGVRLAQHRAPHRLLPLQRAGSSAVLALRTGATRAREHLREASCSGAKLDGVLALELRLVTGTPSAPAVRWLCVVTEAAPFCLPTTATTARCRSGAGTPWRAVAWARRPGVDGVAAAATTVAIVAAVIAVGKSAHQALDRPL